VKRASVVALAFAFAALPAASASADTVYTVDNGAPALLAKFDSATPQNVTVIGPITGLLGPPASDLVTAIDFRPADGKLYAISNQNRLYTIDTSTAAATAVSQTPFTPLIPTPNIGADFDPVRDVLRMVTDGLGGPRVNLQISPTTGQSITDTQTHRAIGDTSIADNPCIAALAYTNAFNTAQSTTLYGLGLCGNVLLRIGSENGDPLLADTGLLSLVEYTDPYVSLVAGLGLRLGFDIAPNGDAYALVQQSCCMHFYKVDLREGAVTLNEVGLLGAQPTGPGVEWRDIAVAPPANDFSLSAPSYSVGEAAAGAAITVTRAGPAIGAASVAYSTADGSATAPSDYTPSSGTLNFAPGQRSATFSVPIVDDAVFEGPESLGVALSGPTGGAASLVDPSSGTLTIQDDDPAPVVLGPAALDTTAPTFALSRQGSRRLAAFLKGVVVKATPGEPAALKLELIAGKVVLASASLPLAAGARTATLKPSPRLVGKRRKAFSVRLQVTATDAAGNRTVQTQTITVKPNAKTKAKR
jgi:hypothetical protein